MADPISVLHPRKLYAMLRACTSAEIRARAAFEFLRGSTAADGGFLFLTRGDALSIAAGSDSEPPAGLIEHVATAWSRRDEAQPDDSRTLDASELQALLNENPRWTSPRDESFERRMLSTHRGPRWVPVGIVMLQERASGLLLPVRHVHVEAICNALIDAGDIPDPGA